MEYSEQAKNILAKLSDKEKAKLLAGADFWHLAELPKTVYDVSGAITLTDGPHGLRKQKNGATGIGLGESEPATCFPTACTTACSFDKELLGEIGEAIADECRTQDVAVILGPGANIKRSPLCGRNFEYFSEDPYLSGKLAAAYINGVQSKGVGASLKHFALNSTEKMRFISDSIADSRTVREIYLPAFEYAVKNAKPWTVMCSYNKVNGTLASENKKLLTDILRKEWGFDGLVVSDWGAVSDRVAGLNAGVDLEMPGADDYSARKVLAALESGEITREIFEARCENVIKLILKAGERQPYKYSMFAHHNLARRAASESIVLLKNDGHLLPANIKQTAAVIGAYAKTPRYQGSGSSGINPTKLENAYDELLKLGLSFEYSEGYHPETEEPDEKLIDEACETARGKDIVYVFAALTAKSEGEGFDRKDLLLPKAQIELIERISRVNDNVCVILSGGGVIDMSWQEGVNAILMCHLAGQAGAGAAAEVLLGLTCPSGKLAESWPLKLEDNPSYEYYRQNGKTSEYREGIYVGYRYYDTAEKEVRYPFGYGLSYTSFELTEATLSKDSFKSGEHLSVSCKIKNTGKVDGAEVVQLYIKAPDGVMFRAKHELKGFEKVFLKAGEEKEVTFSLNRRSFAYYYTSAALWYVAGGRYEAELGFSSRDIVSRLPVDVEGDEIPETDLKDVAACYYDLTDGIKVSAEEFEAVLGRPISRENSDKGFDLNSTLKDISSKALGRIIVNTIKRQATKLLKNDEATKKMMEASLDDMPLRALCMGSPKFTRGTAAGIAEILNGHPIVGLKRMKE